VWLETTIQGHDTIKGIERTAVGQKARSTKFASEGLDFARVIAVVRQVEPVGLARDAAGGVGSP